MPDLTVKASDIWTAVAGRTFSGTGPLVTLVDRAELPATAAYVLLKLRRKCVAELQDLDKAREAICKELAEKDEAGNPKTREDGGYEIADLPAFGERFNALLQQDVTLTGVRKLTLHEFGSAKVTAGELEQLGPFLDDSAEAA